jgi:hypothetical protein
MFFCNSFPYSRGGFDQIGVQFENLLHCVDKRANNEAFSLERNLNDYNTGIDRFFRFFEAEL